MIDLGAIKKRRSDFDAITPDDYASQDEDGLFEDEMVQLTCDTFWATLEDDEADLIAEVERLQCELAKFKPHESYATCCDDLHEYRTHYVKEGE